MSKKQGVTAVKASSGLEPRDFLSRCEILSQQKGFRVERYGAVPALDAAGNVLPVATATGSRPPPDDVTALPLLACTRRTAGVRPRVYLSSGIHGDEPAGPETLLQLLAEGIFDDRATWLLAPLLNPVGFYLRTRENAAAIDLNRDYHAPRTAEIEAHVRWLQRQPPFDLALCLHEDWEATGFYLYELNPAGRRSLAEPMLAAAGAHLPIDPASVIDGRAVTQPGIIRPDHDPRLRDLWAEAIYLRAHHTDLCYTLETPSSLPLAQRVAAMAAAVRAALKDLTEKLGGGT